MTDAVHKFWAGFSWFRHDTTDATKETLDSALSELELADNRLRAVTLQIRALQHSQPNSENLRDVSLYHDIATTRSQIVAARVNALRRALNIPWNAGLF